MAAVPLQVVELPVAQLVEHMGCHVEDVSSTPAEPTLSVLNN